MDQGKTLLTIYQLWQDKKFTLIGPESSIKTNMGRTFFHGPWIYYFLLPVMLIANWNPFTGAYLFIGLNLLALIILFKAIKQGFGFRTALISSFLFTFTPNVVRFSQFFWNPNFLPLVSSLIIFLGVKIKKKANPLLFFLLGLTLGFGIGCHYQVVLLTAAVISCLVYKKSSFKNILILLLGLIAGLSPLIIFELRHNFYNLKTLSLILNDKGQKNISFPFPFYYYLSFMPFFFLAIGIILNKIYKKNQLISIIIILIFSIYSVYQIVSSSNQGFTMAKGWDYKGIQKTANIIIKENIKNYNIASFLSGDTRAYPIRFLLTKANNPPLSVEAYPQANYLYVVSQHDNSKTINNPVWEISSFCPCKIIKTWPIQNNISLYLLKKE